MAGTNLKKEMKIEIGNENENEDEKKIVQLKIDF